MHNFHSVALSFSKAATSYQSHAHMQNAMGRELLAFLHQTLSAWGVSQNNTQDFPNADTIHISDIKQNYALSKMYFPVTLEIGCGPGNFTQKLISKLSFSKLILNDLSNHMLEQAYKKAVSQVKVQGEAQDSEINSSLVLEQSPSQVVATNIATIPVHNAITTPSATTAPSATGSLVDHRTLQVERLEGNILDVHAMVSSPVDLIVSNAVFQWLPLSEALAVCRKLAQLPDKTNRGVGAIWSLQDEVSQNHSWCGCCHGDKPRDTCVETAISNQGAELAKLTQYTKAARQDQNTKLAKKACLPQSKIPCLLAFSSFSAGNFAELKQLGHSGLDYVTLDEVRTYLERFTQCFAIGCKTQRQYFASSTELFRHLKLTGVNGLGRTLNAGRMRSLIKDYDRHFRDKKGVYLTWCPYYVVAML